MAAVRVLFVVSFDQGLLGAKLLARVDALICDQSGGAQETDNI
jgi:hypothetical protein